MLVKKSFVGFNFAGYPILRHPLHAHKGDRRAHAAHTAATRRAAPLRVKGRAYKLPRSTLLVLERQSRHHPVAVLLDLHPLAAPGVDEVGIVVIPLDARAVAVVVALNDIHDDLQVAMRLKGRLYCRLVPLLLLDPVAGLPPRRRHQALCALIRAHGLHLDRLQRRINLRLLSVEVRAVVDEVGVVANAVVDQRTHLRLEGKFRVGDGLRQQGELRLGLCKRREEDVGLQRGRERLPLEAPRAAEADLLGEHTHLGKRVRPHLLAETLVKVLHAVLHEREAEVLGCLVLLGHEEVERHFAYLFLR